ncbi:MAG TPA: response regulator transcription factor, partial [bacterium]|nr:response regulator transcription factor [bacterium]
MSLRILLADDHGIFRQGVKALLEREGFRVDGEAADGHTAIQMAAQLTPDVVVVDLAMPLLNGLDAAREITRVSPRTRTILLTMHAEDPYVARALQAGVRGYVLKSQAAEDLVQAIREVARGAVYLSPGVSQTVVEAYLAKRDLPADPLTPREHQVLQLI